MKSKTQKSYFLFIVIAILFNISISNAQRIKKKIEFNSQVISLFQVINFSSQVTNNKAYFKYLIVENEENVNYVLEFSVDGKNYSDLVMKEAFLSPNYTPLLYCYQIDLVGLSATYYRVRREKGKNISYSKILRIEKPNLLTLKNKI